MEETPQKSKIQLSKTQYETIEGIANYTSQSMFEVTYGIIEFGITYLIALSFEKAGGGKDDRMQQMIDEWNKDKTAMKFSKDITDFLQLDDQKKYISKKGFFSFLKPYYLEVTDGQKLTINGGVHFSGLPEKLCNMYVWGAGMTFMLLASKEVTQQDKEEMKNDYLKDKTMMRLADELRKSWEVGNELHSKNNK